MVFVILGPQLRVPSLVIEFDTVRVEYEGNDTRLELSGEATWSQPDVDPGVRVESYQLEIESNTVAVSLVGSTAVIIGFILLLTDYHNL